MNRILFNFRRLLSWNLIKLANKIDDREDSFVFDSDIQSMHEYKKRLIIFTKKHIYSYKDKGDVQRIKVNQNK